jgi:hypothetical protein
MAISTSRIFLESQNGASLIPLTETAYEKEAHLQELLAKCPDLIPGDQIGDSPRRWLLISREMSVPDEDGMGRWSLDHLFVDQNSIPTFVECKRSSDTRGRREVVAQMLDYAANGVAHWTPDEIRAAADKTAKAKNASLDQELEKFLDLDDSTPPAEAIEKFWGDLNSNLKSRHIRLIFVADKIPPELKKLVEFMNEEMTNVEVLAVEVKQYLEPNAQQKVLVPILIGATEQAKMTKQIGARNELNVDQFMSKCPENTQAFFREVIQRTENLEDALIAWGALGFKVRTRDKEGKLHSLVYCYPEDSFGFSLDNNLSTDERLKASLRQQLLASGLVSERGKFTIRAPITMESADRLLELIENAVKFVTASYKQSE